MGDNKLMKRTSKELYDYETKRIKKYLKEIDKILRNNIEDKEDLARVEHLIKWYGNARAIKSKAYQEMNIKPLRLWDVLKNKFNEIKIIRR